MAYKLTTITSVKRRIKGDLKAGFDSLIDSIIDQVGVLFAEDCRRPDFDLKERTEFYNPRPGATSICVKSPPIVQDPGGTPAYPAVQIWQSTSFPRAYTSAELLVNGTDYIVDEDKGIIEFAVKLAGGPQTIKIVYSGGYLTDNAVGGPSGLDEIAATQAEIFFSRRSDFGLTARAVEGASISVGQFLTLPNDISKQLTPWRLEPRI